jgi:hypothetical protein
MGSAFAALPMQWDSPLHVRSIARQTREARAAFVPPRELLILALALALAPLLELLHASCAPASRRRINPRYRIRDHSALKPRKILAAQLLDDREALFDPFCLEALRFRRSSDVRRLEPDEVALHDGPNVSIKSRCRGQLLKRRADALTCFRVHGFQRRHLQKFRCSKLHLGRTSTAKARLGTAGSISRLKPLK